MQKKYRERLEKMIEILSGIRSNKIEIGDVKAVFNLRAWKYESEKCGTVMCACGYAASHAWFTKRGFRLVADTFDKNVSEINCAGERGWDAVMKFFGLSFNEASHLFNRQKYDQANPTPRHVVSRLKAFLCEKT